MSQTPIDKFKKIKNPTKNDCLEALDSVLGIGFSEEQDEVIYFKKLYNLFPEDYKNDQKFNEDSITKSNGKVFPLINNPTEKMVLNSLEYNAWIIGSVPKSMKNEEFYLKAVEINPLAIESIKKPSFEVCKAAIKADISTFSYINSLKPSPEICLYALSLDNSLFTEIKICPNPNYETTVSNLKKMSVVGKNQQLVKETIKQL